MQLTSNFKRVMSVSEADSRRRWVWAAKAGTAHLLFEHFQRSCAGQTVLNSEPAVSHPWCEGRKSEDLSTRH